MNNDIQNAVDKDLDTIRNTLHILRNTYSNISTVSGHLWLTTLINLTSQFSSLLDTYNMECDTDVNKILDDIQKGRNANEKL